MKQALNYILLAVAIIAMLVACGDQDPEMSVRREITTRLIATAVAALSLLALTKTTPRQTIE